MKNFFEVVMLKVAAQALEKQSEIIKTFKCGSPDYDNYDELTGYISGYNQALWDISDYLLKEAKRIEKGETDQSGEEA